MIRTPSHGEEREIHIILICKSTLPLCCKFLQLKQQQSRRTRMTTWNTSKRRLMPDSGTTYRYELQHVSEPNLLREVFPYSTVPKVVFDGVSADLDPAPEFFITDTTFRDGQQ